MYVPTNHLYLGDIVICERERVSFPDISVEDGIRIFLTGGMALPDRAALIIRPFVRGAMSVTVQKLLGRLAVPMFGVLLCAVLFAASRPILAADGQPPSQAESASAHQGGEANLVLPDLSTVDFHGINGRVAADERPCWSARSACCSVS